MAALAVAIIGGPLTMTFLALETTGDFVLSLVMLGASTVVSVVVRRSFGYSFATWRLHLRGESIRSAQDIGWMRTLTVARLMRSDVRTARLDMTLADFREEFPLGSTQWAVIVDKAGRYAGLVSVPDAHLAEAGPGTAGLGTANLMPLLRCKGDVLLPQMNIKEAADLFERSENEALAVIEDRIGLRVVGILSESYVLRRYTEELDKARRDLAGENWIREG
jgi:CIC family chloride channel protein